jgi:hypothetical protein
VVVQVTATKVTVVLDPAATEVGERAQVVTKIHHATNQEKIPKNSLMNRL